MRATRLYVFNGIVMKYLLFIMLILSFVHTVYAEFSATLSGYDMKRFQLLTKEIRCVVCQNQNIADSNAPLANDLREKVYQLVNEKKSNEEIKDYLVKRYGEFILLQPRFNKLTFLLWGFPFIGLTCVFFFFLRYIRIQQVK